MFDDPLLERNSENEKVPWTRMLSFDGNGLRLHCFWFVESALGAYQTWLSNDVNMVILDISGSMYACVLAPKFHIHIMVTPIIVQLALQFQWSPDFSLSHTHIHTDTHTFTHDTQLNCETGAGIFNRLFWFQFRPNTFLHHTNNPCVFIQSTDCGAEDDFALIECKRKSCLTRNCPHSLYNYYCSVYIRCQSSFCKYGCWHF